MAEVKGGGEKSSKKKLVSMLRVEKEEEEDSSESEWEDEESSKDCLKKLYVPDSYDDDDDSSVPDKNAAMPENRSVDLKSFMKLKLVEDELLNDWTNVSNKKATTLAHDWVQITDKVLDIFVTKKKLTEDIYALIEDRKKSKKESESRRSSQDRRLKINKGKFHHSSNSDFGPTKSPPYKKSKKKVEKTKEENFPLLSNVVRTYAWDDTPEHILKSIGEEDARSFEESFEKIYESELHIHQEIDFFTDRFSQLIKTARASSIS